MVDEGRFTSQFKPADSIAAGKGFTFLDLSISTNIAIYTTPNEPDVLRFADLQNIKPLAKKIKGLKREHTELLEAEKKIIDNALNDLIKPYSDKGFYVIERKTNESKTGTEGGSATPSLNSERYYFYPENDYVLLGVALAAAENIKASAMAIEPDKKYPVNYYFGHEPKEGIEQVYKKNNELITLEWAYPKNTSVNPHEVSVYLRTLQTNTSHTAGFVLLEKQGEGSSKKAKKVPEKKAEKEPTIEELMEIDKQKIIAGANYIIQDIHSRKMKLVFSSGYPKVVGAHETVFHSEGVLLEAGKKYLFNVLTAGSFPEITMKLEGGSDEVAIKQVKGENINTLKVTAPTTSYYRFSYALKGYRSAMLVYIIVSETDK